MALRISIEALWRFTQERDGSSLLVMLDFGSVTGRLEREQFAPEDAGLLSKLVARAAAPLFQPQDSLNRRAEELLGIVVQLDVPMEQYPEAIERATASQEPDGMLPVRSLYNPVGELLLAISSSYFAPHWARVADLEGVRRAAVLATTLRAQAVPAADVPARLGSGGMEDPYTGLPFEWDAAASAIIFNGIERSGRGRHVLRY